MFLRKKIVLALLAAGVVSGVLLQTSGAADDESAAVLVGIADPLCVPLDATSRQNKAFFKIAEAKNELRPFVETRPAAHESEDAILFDNLGTLSYRVTTSNALALKFFDQGLRLAYGFNHAEARRAFRKAQQLDPECAMCYWGEALVLGPHINAPMEPAAKV